MGFIKSRRVRGMSMVEILIAYTVLLVAVLALLGSLPMATRQQQDGITTLQAQYYAEQKMDELMHDNVYITAGTDTVGSEQPMNRVWDVTYLSDDAQIQVVTVTVSWTSNEGGLRNVKLRSWTRT